MSNLEQIVTQHREGWAARSFRQQRLEAENNEAVAKQYGLENEISANTPLEEVSLTNNSAFRWPDKSLAERDRLFEKTVITDLISYSVGCMFGRFSLDKPGLILANQGASLRDYYAQVPSPTFVPDKDNVLPIVNGDWFEDDIVAKFRQFLRITFGEKNFEENLRFVESCLDVKDVRDYFISANGRSKFYADHISRYKKRPIYWLFSSSKGSFNALIYLHRYTTSTVSTLLNEYLRAYSAKLEASLTNLETSADGGNSARQRASALKESERIRKILVELDEYEHNLLYPLASEQIEIDLDDGVLKNYQKFGTALKKF